MSTLNLALNDNDDNSGISIDYEDSVYKLRAYDFNVIGVKLSYITYAEAEKAAYKTYELFNKYRDVVGHTIIFNYIQNVLLYDSGRLNRYPTLVENHLQAHAQNELPHIYAIDNKGRCYWYYLTSSHPAVSNSLMSQALVAYVEYVYTENGWLMGEYFNPKKIEEVMQSGAIFEYLGE
ncbi:hypothetical protein ABGV42_01805 [Paenibacillus pabuli]|uniref:hypothetical protein n=1 Tax=Paenibacillus pabuli TaxID=1472 RepID=UPI00324229C6